MWGKQASEASEAHGTLPRSAPTPLKEESVAEARVDHTRIIGFRRHRDQEFNRWHGRHRASGCNAHPRHGSVGKPRARYRSERLAVTVASRCMPVANKV